MIIGLTGAAFSGKDTVGIYLARSHNFSMFAFADPIREGLKAMLDLTASDFKPENKERTIDWIGRSPRQLMQSLGTEWGRELVGATIWTDHMARRIDSATRAGEDVVITDVRFNTEVDLIKRLGGEIWRVSRPNAETTSHWTHRSETEAAAIAHDRQLINDGTVEQLYEQIVEALGYSIPGSKEVP